MNEVLREMEGTWEEVAAFGARFAGRCRVRLTLLDTAADEREVVIPSRPLPTSEEAQLGIMPAVSGTQPITDIEDWLASLPHFDGTDAEFAAFEQGLAQERTLRRQASAEKGN